MKNEQNLSIRQNQKLIMTLAMQQAMEVLQMPLDELAIWIEKEVLQNPLLELHPTKSSNYDFVDQAATESLTSFLQKESAILFESEEDKQVAKILCGFLDDKGFLTASFDEIASICNQPISKIKHIAHQISQLDPPGLVTPDLQHSLLAQLEKANKQASIGYTIIKEHWEAFKQLKLDPIAKKLKLSKQQFEYVIQKDIRPLNPTPAAIFSSGPIQCITPDFTIAEENGKLILYFPNDTLPQFQIQDTYLSSIEDDHFTRRWLARGKWLDRIISKRHRTLENIGKLLIQHQSSFFLGLKSSPIPLRASTIAKELNLNISTVSRALNAKYIDTPKGLFPLVYFTSTTTLSSLHHTQEVHQALFALIKKEDKQKPYSDQVLAKFLGEQGIKISRRTVAKYRTALRIPSAFSRKKN